MYHAYRSKTEQLNSTWYFWPVLASVYEPLSFSLAYHTHPASRVQHRWLGQVLLIKILDAIALLYMNIAALLLCYSLYGTGTPG